MKILVTGGAGFIGSNIVKALLKDSRVAKVRVLDNLATGSKKNISEFISNEKFEFINGDIRNIETCMAATKGIDKVTHQAALGSVPRSIKDPITTNNVNITGTLNIFNASIENNINRVVFAASSSTYGDSKNLPKIEHTIGSPLSPYAVTKYVNELYADVLSRFNKFEYIGLRYFNVFGPKQDPNGAYAAVIPLFFKAAVNGESPKINGDGSFSRDFTFVENAVSANILALFTDNQKAVNEIYNVACGESISLNSLWAEIKEITKTKALPNYGLERVGDIAHSLADITKAKNLLNYKPLISTEEGLHTSYAWYKKLFNQNV